MDLAASQGREAALEEAATFEDAVLSLHPALVRRLTLVVSDPHEAEDLAQQAVMRAFQAWPGFDGRDARAWLFTIGLRLAFNEKRRRGRLFRALRRLPPPRPWHPEVDVDLWAALGEVDRQPRAALLLSVLDGYTQAEIGVMLGVPVGTVGSWLSRTKAQLRLALTKDGS